MCTYIVIQQQKRRYVNQALGECTSCQGDIPYQDRKAVPESNKENEYDEYCCKWGFFDLVTMILVLGNMAHPLTASAKPRQIRKPNKAL